MRRLVLLPVLLCALPGPARARPVRAINLDSDATGKLAVVVGTVTRIRVAPRAQRRAGLQPLIVEVRVRRALHLPGSHRARGPRVLHVLHSRRLPMAAPRINAFSPKELAFGRTYLLFLLRTGKHGVYRLVAPEDPYLVELPSYAPWVWKSLPPRGSVLEQVVTLLMNRVQRCYRRCMGEIWLLGGSSRFRTRPRFSRQRRTFVQALKRIAGRSLDPNTLTAAYTVLGQLGVTSEIKPIVRYICHPPRRNRVTTPAGAIHWLQGYPEPVQIRALRRILGCVSDPGARRQARSSLRYLVRRPSRRP